MPRFKPGQIVKFIDPPKEEFWEVLAIVVRVDEDYETLVIKILPEFIEKNPKLSRRNLYRFNMSRFAICKKLTEGEWVLYQELKAKDVRTPVEEYILSGLETI